MVDLDAQVRDADLDRWLSSRFVADIQLRSDLITLYAFEAELMDPRRRGEYQGAAELSGTLGHVWAPAAFTFLAMTWSTWGWLVIAGVMTAAAAALHPSTAMARRFLEQHVPADVLADAAAHDTEDAPLGPPTVEQPAQPGGDSPLGGLPESTGDLIR